MSELRTNIFTLQQARQTLPLIRPIVDDASSCQRTIKDRIREHHSDTETNPSDSNVQEVRTTDRDIRTFRQKLTNYVNELYQIGAELHDYNLGRVDFPSRLEHRVVYLCWEQGENDIQNWHEVYEPCHERKAIEDQHFNG